MVLQKIYKELVEIFGNAGIKISQAQFTHPPKFEMGDIALPCFLFAKEKGKSPNVIADEIFQKIKGYKKRGSMISEISVSGPYVNIYFDKAKLAKKIFSEIRKQGKKFGTQKRESKKIMFEYSQPNTHKAFHIGHLRNAVLGASIIKLLESQGNKVEGVTYVNDVGSHVAKCLWGLKKFYNGQIPQNERGRFLGNVYAKAAQELENNPEFKEQVQELLKKLENGDKEIAELWKETRQWSIDGFNAIYNDLKIKFDDSYFESDIKADGQKVVDELLERGIAKKSRDVIVMDLSEFNLDVLVIRKSDGVGLYSTSDLGLARKKSEKKWDESIVMTDVRQDLYFKQLHKTLELYGFARIMRHIGYEFVKLKEGSMSSRTGQVVLYEDFRDEVVEHAERETKKRHEDWNDEKVKNTARALAISAIKFSMLKIKPEQVITFDKEEALSFIGYSAPYILYTFARIESILKKVGEVDEKFDYSFEEPEEKKLILMLARFEEIVSRARADEDPSEICRFVFELAQEFSSFYEKCSVKNADCGVRIARVRLIKAMSQVIKNGLEILGIETMDEM